MSHKPITIEQLRADIPEEELAAIADGAARYLLPPDDDDDERAFPVDDESDLTTS